MLETAVAVLIFNLRREIFCHAGHPRCTQRFNAGPLGGFEDGARRTGRRHNAAVNFGIMATDVES